LGVSFGCFIWVFHLAISLGVSLGRFMNTFIWPFHWVFHLAISWAVSFGRFIGCFIGTFIWLGCYGCFHLGRFYCTQNVYCGRWLGIVPIPHWAVSLGVSFGCFIWPFHWVFHLAVSLGVSQAVSFGHFIGCFTWPFHGQFHLAVSLGVSSDSPMTGTGGKTTHQDDVKKVGSFENAISGRMRPRLYPRTAQQVRPEGAAT
jgi:hypothetical protein